MADSTRFELIWKNTMQALKVTPDVQLKWSNIVLEKYSETQRHYHTICHVDHILDLFNKYCEHLTDKNALVLAIVFHDIIYNPQSGSNEEDSAELFQSFAEETGLDLHLKEKVYKWIIATKLHQINDSSKETDADLKYFLDFDLAILGEDPAMYKQYAAQIRKEYSHFSDEDYKNGRSKVLAHFLKSDLYFTQILRAKFNDQAKINMKNELDSFK